MNQYRLTFRPGGNVVELGGGQNPIIHPNVDVTPGPNVDIVADFEKKLPFTDKSFDGIFCQYGIEHISWRNVEQFIREMARILKDNGKAVIITANLLEQCKSVIDEGVTKDTVERVFGSQEFPQHAGVHKCGFSPEYAEQLFKKNGFDFVKIIEHPESTTDMILECYKFKDGEIFERAYFEDGTIGYDGYRDFGTHYSTARILLNITPKIESILDIGGGRGYVDRILNAEGIGTTVMDISKHCRDTRVIEEFILHDATQVPWLSCSDCKKEVMPDKAYDVAFSMNFLEHIPLERLDDVIREMARVSKRGIHGIHFSVSPYVEQDPDIDITHCISETKEWWLDRFKSVAPDYHVLLEHPRLLEYDEPEKQPPISHVPKQQDVLVKVNLGSYMDMFYYNWINIDILDLHEHANNQAFVFKQHDVTKGLPFEDNSVDIIYQSHLLEHLDRGKALQLLKECFRVLKKGGIMRLIVPDTKKIAKQYVEGRIDEYRYINVGVENGIDDADSFYNLLMAGHKTLYDASLNKTLQQIGFTDITVESPFHSRSDIIQKQTYPCHHIISLVLEMVK